jgi:hypothetical protein
MLQGAGHLVDRDPPCGAKNGRVRSEMAKIARLTPGKAQDETLRSATVPALAPAPVPSPGTYFGGYRQPLPNPRTAANPKLRGDISLSLLSGGSIPPEVPNVSSRRPGHRASSASGASAGGVFEVSVSLLIIFLDRVSRLAGLSPSRPDADERQTYHGNTRQLHHDCTMVGFHC